MKSRGGRSFLGTLSVDRKLTSFRLLLCYGWSFDWL